MVQRECDTFNLLAAIGMYKTVAFDVFPGKQTYGSYKPEEMRAYYGSSSLRQEHKMLVRDNQIILNGNPVKAYHLNQWKPRPEAIFPTDVCEFIKEITNGKKA